MHVHVSEDAPMNFPAQRILSFCWFHSEVVTPPKVDL